MNSIISVLLIIVTLIRLCKLEENRKQTPRTLKKQICNEITDFDAFKRYDGAIFGNQYRYLFCKVVLSEKFSEIFEIIEIICRIFKIFKSY